MTSMRRIGVRAGSGRRGSIELCAGTPDRRPRRSIHAGRRIGPGDASSGHAEISVFCWPCDLSPGDLVPNELSADLDGELKPACLEDWPAALKSDLSQERLERWPGKPAWAWRGCGRVVDPERGLIEVLGFRIDWGDIAVPQDTAVEFCCERFGLRAF